MFIDTQFMNSMDMQTLMDGNPMVPMLVPPEGDGHDGSGGMIIGARIRISPDTNGRKLKLATFSISDGCREPVFLWRWVFWHTFDARNLYLISLFISFQYTPTLNSLTAALTLIYTPQNMRNIHVIDMCTFDHAPCSLFLMWARSLLRGVQMMDKF